VTWGFVYLSVLLVGLVLAAVTGLICDFPVIASHRHLVVPRPEQHLSGLNLLGRRLGLTMVAFGAVGLLLQAWGRLALVTSLSIAGGAALVTAVSSFVLLRTPCLPALATEQATVVRDMSPGGYGQVRVGEGDCAAVVAARSADEEALPAGTLVEIVDCSRSVIIVRKPGGAVIEA
jgi:hypothetical protein